MKVFKRSAKAKGIKVSVKITSADNAEVVSPDHLESLLEGAGNLAVYAATHSEDDDWEMLPAERVKAVLFKDSGKYYTEEFWNIPDGAIGPYDMIKSRNFRRIGGGAVLIPSQEPWGFPFLFNAIESEG